MNRAIRRAAAARARARGLQVVDGGNGQQKCVCGWLMPRESWVELYANDASDVAPALIVLKIECPMCGVVATVEIAKAATA